MNWVKIVIITTASLLPAWSNVLKPNGDMASGWMQETYKYICKTCDNFKRILSSSLNAQAYSCIALQLAIYFFFASPLFSTLTELQQFLTCVFFFLNTMFLLPLPINLEESLKDLGLGYHALLKSVMAFGSYLFFDWVGKAMTLHEDFNMATSSVWYLMYLLTTEARFHFEEELAICDGFLFAGYGLMINQNVIPSWLVVIVGPVSLTSKNYIQMCYSKRSVDVKSKGPIADPVFIKILHYSRSLGYISLAFATQFFYASSYLWNLTRTQQGFSSVFFLMTWILMLKFPPLIQWEGRMKLFYQALLKSGLSFACNYLSQWIGESMNFREDMKLMNFSLAFLIYLLTIEARYHVEDTVALCEGFLFAGFGLMMAQKAIPMWIVVLVGLASLSTKNYVQMSWKQQQSLVVDEMPPETIDKTQCKKDIRSFLALLD
ncbi:unnamed protein product [Arabis nemorensis]|uniref:Cas1p 10 TM acyl transferase domain-containing protein n=1 Tax=Arabis nemorensis TaxID=586526 RepID=A0A565BM76_9BRAS|nr:unnamed protein product [Arabis nemorensis]VVB02458.1 unnamed protein product [Arabis nemorensis]